MNVGESKTFSYTGGMQSFTVDTSGVYKLEVVGANGAHQKFNSAHGGYACGYKLLKKGDVIYICCGQAGSFGNTESYNGGGAGITPSGNTWNNPSGSGGGATHMATVSGTLYAIGSTNISKILIVAGGSGGETNTSGSGAYGAYTAPGGYGGGTSGGNGGTGHSGGTPASPGTQTSGYAFGKGQSASKVDVYGGDALACGAGGGGLYGGYAGANAVSQGGAGGSGYVGGVPSFTYKDVIYSPSMTNNYNSSGSNGYATITFVVKSTLPVIFNGTTLEKIVFNGTEITSLVVNGTKLFIEKIKRRVCEWSTLMKMGNLSSRRI